MRAISRFYRPLAWTVAVVMLVGLAAARAQAAKSVEGTVPQAASAMARQIDRQVAERLGQIEAPAQGVSLSVTVPVDINDLDESNPLARQMAEELARWFVQAGYSVQEIRKGRMVLIEPGTGEKLLTRRDSHLASPSVESAAILTGTYTITSRNARFNIRIMQTATRDVLGMATVSIPLTGEVKSLLGGNGSAARSFAGLMPSVGTILP